MTRRSRQLSAGQVQLLTTPAEPWLSCEACFDLMDVVVDHVVSPAAGGPADDVRTRLLAHLRGCPACAEEVETLLELVCAEAGVDSGPGRVALGLQADVTTC